jgi:hypothetical protein
LGEIQVGQILVEERLRLLVAGEIGDLALHSSYLLFNASLRFGASLRDR